MHTGNQWEGGGDGIIVIMSIYFMHIHTFLMLSDIFSKNHVHIPEIKAQSSSRLDYIMSEPELETDQENKFCNFYTCMRFILRIFKTLGCMEALRSKQFGEIDGWPIF